MASEQVTNRCAGTDVTISWAVTPMVFLRQGRGLPSIGMPRTHDDLVHDRMSYGTASQATIYR